MTRPAPLDDRDIRQGLWRVEENGRLEEHADGPYAGLWLGPAAPAKSSTGVTHDLMMALVERGLVTIGPSPANGVRRRAATLTDAGKRLCRPPPAPKPKRSLFG